MDNKIFVEMLIIDLETILCRKLQVNEVDFLNCLMANVPPN